MNELEKAESSLPIVNVLRSLMLSFINETGERPTLIYMHPRAVKRLTDESKLPQTHFMGCRIIVHPLIPYGVSMVTKDRL